MARNQSALINVADQTSVILYPEPRVLNLYRERLGQIFHLFGPIYVEIYPVFKSESAYIGLQTSIVVVLLANQLKASVGMRQVLIQ